MNGILWTSLGLGLLGFGCSGPSVGGQSTADTGESLPPEDDPVVQVAFTVHVETSGLEDDAVYLGLVEEMGRWAQMFEARGASLTYEVKQVVGEAVSRGDSVLLDLEERGHELGLHVDVGSGLGAPSTYEDLVAEFSSRREELEGLGVSVHHASGVCSPDLDWVGALAEAGLAFATGLVEYCLKALPLEEQDSRVRECESPTQCHAPVPYALTDRMTSWRVDSAETLLAPSEGGLIAILPKVGGIYCLDEGEGPDAPACALDEADVAAVEPLLETAWELAGGTEEVVHVDLGFSSLHPPDPALLEEILSAVDASVATGKARWSTVSEHYLLFSNGLR